jgi:predicted phosphodiesterase
MRIAALYDIHGNLPALEAVLEELRAVEVDRIVVGGDVVPGPMPRETLRCLLNLDQPVHFIHGNGELAALALLTASDEASVTYWGTTSGRPLPEQYRPAYRWTAEQLRTDFQDVLSRWPRSLRLEIPPLGQVLFCHGTPRSETEIVTRLTPEERLAPLLHGLDVAVVVCGHTHMQFDRQVGGTRVINAGSVGEPYGTPGAHWLLLGPDVQLRQTPYDLTSAAGRIAATAYPTRDEFTRRMLDPPSETEMLELFTPWEVKEQPTVAPSQKMNRCENDP